jgi:hypothetical protein
MKIEKSFGCTETEKILSKLCDRTFLNIWNYANPFNQERKELCDVIAVFENHIFIFFDRNKNLDFTSEADFGIKWSRWHKEVIEKQIKTCHGAERYIKTGGKLYLDNNLNQELPVKYDLEKVNIHKIIVAHGAKDACLNFSEENIYGSLAICYRKLVNDKPVTNSTFPFYVNLENENPIHVFDSHNLEIVLTELDTFQDFTNYITQKEKAIKENIFITYTGEEDLLAHYFMNFDEKNDCHFIGVKENVGFCIEQGMWDKFVKSPAYQVKKEENKISYFWDELINEFGACVLEGNLLGNRSVFMENSGIYEMAKEQRFIRRMLSEKMIEVIENFPDTDEPMRRYLRVLDSSYKNVKYVFLQYKIDFKEELHNEDKVHEARKYFLKIACGATKLKFPELEKIVGIGMSPPKYYPDTTKDILLMNCSNWNEEMENYYKAENEHDYNRFYLNGNVKCYKVNIKEFTESRLE